jgi:hypothetical protein
MSTLSLVEQQGFAIFPEVLLPHEAQSLLHELDQSTLRRSKAGIRHALKHPAIAALARNQRLLHLAQEILGSEAIPFRATLFRQIPSSELARGMASRIQPFR